MKATLHCAHYDPRPPVATFPNPVSRGYHFGPRPLLSRSPYSRRASPAALPTALAASSIFFGATSVKNHGTTSFMWLTKLVFPY